ncbi:MAG TPA: helix-turn-helix transcriptional regulator [Aquabacterium sp.]|nr:helix-turn-helix transcriptional regulator [Aquabacterium sp.]
MPLPDLDATVRGLYCAATCEAGWEAELAALRDALGAADLQVIAGAAVPATAPHCLCIGLPSAGAAAAVQITWAADGPPDAATRAWLARLAPHLGDALRAARRLRQLPPRAALGRVLLERLPQPAWLLQADGRIDWENGPARVERAVGPWLLDDATRLLPRHPGHRQALEQAIHRALAALTRRRLLVPVEAAGPEGVAAPPSRAHWLVRRMDAPPAFAGPQAAGAAPVLLVVLFDPTHAEAAPPAPPDQVEVLGTVYGFTPAESRVAQCLAQGATVRQIAAMLDVAPSTIRSHLDAVTAKLGVERKLDAVRLLVQSGWMWRGGDAGGAGDA